MGVPLIDYSTVPLKGVPGVSEDDELDERTREAANDVLTNPAWNGKVVVMIWEHKHIANAKLEKKATSPVTLRTLLHLDALGKTVPKTWSGTNYDYFWIVRYGVGSPVPTSFTTRKRSLCGALRRSAAERLETPDNLPAGSLCE